MPVETLPEEQSVRITLSGHVQGVGFRPFVYRTATKHGLVGQVQNRMGEVDILAAGTAVSIERFLRDLIDVAPPLSRPVIDAVIPVARDACESFSIAESSANATARVFVPPDYFMCDDCRSELQDPADRRYRYPFINCTQCGPRYTLIRRLPYDRQNTSMAAFPLCADCAAEYSEPGDRRFHAEPLACPACGPKIRFVRVDDDVVLTGEQALSATIDCLREGRIVAVKGVGGYHLMCDARDSRAVATLRRRKMRPDKPLAVMFPVTGRDGLAAVRRSVRLSADEADALGSPMRPIVLVRKRSGSGLADNVAAGLAELGVFLPYAPLHQLLLADFGAPLVATSGNVSGEPVLTDAAEAGRRLSKIADAFLHHDRPILRPADDPVCRRVAGKVRPLRTGRGSAPLEMDLPAALPRPVLAVGGHMKGTVALGWERRAVVSPHIGEMDSPRSMAVFASVLADLQDLYGVKAEQVICDAHPGYATHRWAMQRAGLPVTRIWHHAAHAAAIAAEYPAESRWLVFTWDGVGLGPDGSLWGGEALLGQAGDWRRVCSMRPFRLPGGDAVGREPWRSAAALHWECNHEWTQTPPGAELVREAWQRQLNSPQTSAVGRLFDAAGAMVCGARKVTFEAAGPMRLEALCQQRGTALDLPLSPDRDGIWRTDWEPLLAVLADERLDPGTRAETFHASLAVALRSQLEQVCRTNRVDAVGLGGGVFQNRHLSDHVVDLLQSDGYRVHLGNRLPCNDAGLSFGQLAEFAASATRSSS